MVHFIEIDGWTWINILIKRLKIETGKLRLFFQLFPKAVTFFVGGGRKTQHRPMRQEQRMGDVGKS